MLPLCGVGIQDAAADAALETAKEAGVKFEPEGPPVVPELAITGLPGAGRERWVVDGFLGGNAMSREQANEACRRASESTWNRLRELAQAGKATTWPKALDQLNAIRRILEGSE